MGAAHVAEATGNHDRLVVAAHQIDAALRAALLEHPEISADVRPAKFIVEGGRADRALDHDLER